MKQCNSQLRASTAPTSNLGPGVEKQLKYHADMLARFHHMVSKIKLPEIPLNYDLAFIIQTITASCLTLRLASVIAHSIFQFLQSRGARIIGLRASVETSFTNEDLTCPIVEWKESDGTDIIALFHYDEAFEPEECSWVMHLGVGRSSTRATGSVWQRSRVDWNVASVSHLKTMFGIAQHILGVLKWPTADACRLYGDSASDNHSDEEYIL